MRVVAWLCCVVLLLALAGGILAGCKGNASTDPNAKEASRQKALKQQDEMKNMMQNMKNQGATQKKAGGAAEGE